MKMENGDSARFLNKFEYRKAYMSTWKELTIYIHGITPERDVKSHNAGKIGTLPIFFNFPLFVKERK